MQHHFQNAFTSTIGPIQQGMYIKTWVSVCELSSQQCHANKPYINPLHPIHLHCYLSLFCFPKYAITKGAAILKDFAQEPAYQT